MLEKTNKEIKEAKRQKCPNATPDRKVIKSLKNAHSRARYSKEPSDRYNLPPVDKSVEARYLVVQSKRDIDADLSKEHQNKSETCGVSIEVSQ